MQCMPELHTTVQMQLGANVLEHRAERWESEYEPRTSLMRPSHGPYAANLH